MKKILLLSILIVSLMVACKPEATASRIASPIPTAISTVTQNSVATLPLSPIATDTPASQFPPGLIYTIGEKSELWLVDANGQPQLLTEQRCATLSPDQRHVLYGIDGQLKCDSGGWTCGEIDSFGSAALSPDGQTIAYDRAGVPWLCRLNGGSHAISLEPFGLTFEKAVNPAWSPDGQMLAWKVYGDEPGTDGWSAIAVLDLSQQKGYLFHRYTIRGGSSILVRSLAWSPDGKWLAVANQAEGFDEKASLWVMRVDGSEEHHLGETELPVWSPDSCQLVFSRLQPEAHSPSETETMLVGVGEWQLHQLDLPSGARVKGWVTLQPSTFSPQP